MCVYVIYFSRNVLRDGFEHSVVLPSSQSHDSVLCSAVADVNWDGTNEILLGTYGKVCCAFHILYYEVIVL